MHSPKELLIAKTDSAKTIEHIKITAGIAVVGLCFGILFGLSIDGKHLSNIVIGAIVGLVLGVVFPALEFWLYPRYKRLSFLRFVIVRTLITTIISLSVILICNLIIQGAIFWDVIPQALLLSIIFSLLFGFLMALGRILGKTVLFNFFTGKYYSPTEESRVMMFLDLKHSTMIAEKIGNKQFHLLLNDVFFDISEPILRHSGEIHKYVGDEAIITWELADGIRNSNCINCFFAISKSLNERFEYYSETYGFVPEFRAGLHAGVIVIGEMGDIKQEIAILGDTVNTAARLEAKCKELQQEILLSESLYNQLGLPKQMFNIFENITLSGKKEAMTLYGMA